MRTLTRDEAHHFYNHFGRKQDLQAFYETPAVQRIIAQGQFGAAQCVLEFGCGTGRIALELLRDEAGPATRYVGLDISRTPGSENRRAAVCREPDIRHDRHVAPGHEAVAMAVLKEARVGGRLPTVVGSAAAM